MPADIQICLFSATLPPDILGLTKHFMRNPAKILVQKEDLTLEGIHQYYIAVEKQEWKMDVLLNLYSNLDINQAIIYCNPRRKVEWLTDKMTSREFTVSSMHGDMHQRERDAVLSEFLGGSSHVLIRTDLGPFDHRISLNCMRLVINYDLPTNRENYIRRIGRRLTAYGRKGVVINFLTNNDMPYMKDIESFCGTTVQELPLNIADLI